jgi:uncharacterized protein (DUF1697 family)
VNRKIIALFRGINVGGRNILPMKSLVEILEGLGYKNIQTTIQSGNVVFESVSEITTKKTNLIQNAIEKKHGFNPHVLFIDSDELNKAIDNNPFPTEIGKVLHFSFLENIPESVDFKQLNELKTTTEEYELKDKVFYFFAPNGIGRSKLAAKVEKILGVNATARNWNTVKKLQTMLSH